MADEDFLALDKAVAEVTESGHDIMVHIAADAKPDWERLIKAAEDILKLAGAR